MMNILGKLPESSAPKGRLDTVGLLKTLRLGLVAAGGAFVGYLITNVVNLDLVTDTTFDETLIQLLCIPVLEAVRRWLVDYQAS